MKKHIVAVFAAAIGLACSDTDQMVDPPLLDASAGIENSADAASREYEVTITNLTTGQPFSPGVIATHTKQASFFSAGEAASEGLRLIAENGDPGTAAGELMATAGVDGVIATMAPVHRVGGPGPTSLSTSVTAGANAKRFSLALMLICTNDGFVGLDGAELPGGFKPQTYYAAGYDGGTELNDELSANVVDACPDIGPVGGASDGNGRVAEGGVVSQHPGIQGGAYLDPAEHGWTDPVASVTVRRIK
jgi:hypothetical protein